MLIRKKIITCHYAQRAYMTLFYVRLFLSFFSSQQYILLQLFEIWMFEEITAQGTGIF